MADKKPWGIGGRVIFLLFVITPGLVIGQLIYDHTDDQWHWPIAGGSAIIGLGLLLWWLRGKRNNRKPRH